MPAWLIQSIYHQVSQFKGEVELLQMQSQQQVDVKQYLNIMSLAFQPYELCQLIIFTQESEKNIQNLCKFLAKYTQLVAPIVSAIHKLEVDAIMGQLSNQFEWSFIQPQAQLQEFRKMLTKMEPNATLSQRQYAIKEFLLGQIASASGATNPTRLLEQLRNRELISPTTMKSGVALPHVISSEILQPSIVCLALDEKIDWGGTFGPVTHIIAMLLPPSAEYAHLGAFRALSLSMLNHKNGEFICQHYTSHELQAIINSFMKVQKTPLYSDQIKAN